MDPISIAGIAVSLIAAASAYAAQRAASKSSILNTETTARADLETEAYMRARGYDTDTIARQDVELKELRESEARLEREVKALRESEASLKEEVISLRMRVVRLERGIPQLSEETIHERSTDPHPRPAPGAEPLFLPE